MRWVAISDVIAHPRLQCKSPAVSQACFQFAFKAQKHMSLRAPVIRLVPRRVLDHAHTNLAKILRPPQRLSRITSMFGYRNFTPIGCRESRGGHFHVAEYSFNSWPWVRCEIQEQPHVSPLSIHFDLCYSVFALITSVVLCGPSVVC